MAGQYYLGAREALTRSKAQVCGPLVLYTTYSQIADDDRAFMSVIKTALIYGGITTKELADETGYGEDVFSRLLCAEGKVPDMSWSQNGSNPCNARHRIFEGINKILRKKGVEPAQPTDA